MSNNLIPAAKNRVYGPSKPDSDFSKPDSVLTQCSTEHRDEDELGDLLGMITAGLLFSTCYIMYII